MSGYWQYGGRIVNKCSLAALGGAARRYEGARQECLLRRVLHAYALPLAEEQRARWCIAGKKKKTLTGSARRLEFEMGAGSEGACGFALVLALSQMMEHGLGPFGRADMHLKRNQSGKASDRSLVSNRVRTTKHPVPPHLSVQWGAGSCGQLR